MKTDFKNVFTNVLAGLVVILTTLQQYFSLATNPNTGNINWETLDWKMISFNVILALVLWMTGKDKDGKAKKYTADGKRLLLIMILPMFLLVGCGTNTIIVSTSPVSETDSLGIEVTAGIVDAVFNSMEKMNGDTLRFTDGAGLAIAIVPQLISSIKEYKTAIEEVKDLSDMEILALVSIADGYNLGSNADKLKQVLKVSLFAVQTYFVFYHNRGFTTQAFLDNYNFNPEMMIYEEFDCKGLAYGKGCGN